MMPEYHIPYVQDRQSSQRPATEWEMELANTIEAAFARDAHDLESLLAALNASWVRPPEGGDWTAARFTALMHELGG